MLPIFVPGPAIGSFPPELMGEFPNPLTSPSSQIPDPLIFVVPV